MIENIRGQINNVFAKVPAQPKILYALKKLPLFGFAKPIFDEIDFCWPAALVEVQQDVSMASLTLKTQANEVAVGSV